jgi:hypothetical protein
MRAKERPPSTIGCGDGGRLRMDFPSRHSLKRLSARRFHRVRISSAARVEPVDSLDALPVDDLDVDSSTGVERTPTTGRPATCVGGI